ncbi:MAG: TIGR01777 family oxidoreductase [Planctomycetaceae bacterium]|nr:TIGR01777 family oxidoreductase [Planctomycetaceae bacterium]
MSKSLRIAVSGSRGLVGRPLCELLTAGGHDVRSILRNPQHDSGKDVIWTPERGVDNPERFQGVDTIIHLAGESIAAGRWTPTLKAKIRDSRVDGTARLVDGLAKCEQRPSTLICASAIGYYGDRGDTVLEESAAPGTGFLPEVCVAWEQAAQRATELGIRVVNIRIGVVLARNGGALAKMLLPFKLGLGGIVGNGRQYWSWIGLTDLIRIIEFAASNSAVIGPVNAVSPHSSTNSEFTRTLGQVLHRPTIFPMPAFAAKLLLGEMAQDLLLASSRVVPQVLLQHGFQFSCPDLRQCLEHELIG